MENGLSWAQSLEPPAGPGPALLVATGRPRAVPPSAQDRVTP